MSAATTSIDERLLAQNGRLRGRLDEAEATLAAIRSGEVDALVVAGPQGDQIYTLSGADRSYRILVEEMHQGAATLGGDGIVLYCNRRLAEILRIPQANLLGASLHSFVTSTSRPWFEALLRRGQAERSQGEVTLRAGDGTQVPVYLAVNPLPVDGGAVVCVAVPDLTEQKRREELVAAERLARSILDQAVDGIVVCDEAGIVIRASRVARELCEKNPILRPFATAFPLHSSAGSTSGQSGAKGDDGQAVSLAGVLSGETLHGVEVCLRRRDGTKVNLILSAGPLRDGRQQIMGCVVTLTDITERNRAAAALQQSEERFRTMANAIPQLAWIAKPDGYIYWYNQRWYEYTGTMPEQMEGWGWQSVHDPQQLPEVLERWEKSIATGEPFDMVFPLLGSDGVFRPFLTRVMPLKDDQGRVHQWFGTNTDVSEQKQAEEALRESEERFRLLLEGVRDYAIVTLDPEGRVTSWSAGAERIKGYRAEEILGQPFTRFYPPEDVRGGLPSRQLQTAAAEGRCEDVGWRVRKDGG